MCCFLLPFMLFCSFEIRWLFEYLVLEGGSSANHQHGASTVIVTADSDVSAFERPALGLRGSVSTFKSAVFSSNSQQETK